MTLTALEAKKIATEAQKASQRSLFAQDYLPKVLRKIKKAAKMGETRVLFRYQKPWLFTPYHPTVESLEALTEELTTLGFRVETYNIRTYKAKYEYHERVFSFEFYINY